MNVARPSTPTDFNRAIEITLNLVATLSTSSQPRNTKKAKQKHTRSRATAADADDNTLKAPNKSATRSLEMMAGGWKYPQVVLEVFTRDLSADEIDICAMLGKAYTSDVVVETLSHQLPPHILSRGSLIDIRSALIHKRGLKVLALKFKQPERPSELKEIHSPVQVLNTSMGTLGASLSLNESMIFLAEHLDSTIQAICLDARGLPSVLQAEPTLVKDETDGVLVMISEAQGVVFPRKRPDSPSTVKEIAEGPVLAPQSPKHETKRRKSLHEPENLTMKGPFNLKRRNSYHGGGLSAEANLTAEGETNSSPTTPLLVSENCSAGPGSADFPSVETSPTRSLVLTPSRPTPRLAGGDAETGSGLPVFVVSDHGAPEVLPTAPHHPASQMGPPTSSTSAITIYRFTTVPGQPKTRTKENGFHGREREIKVVDEGRNRRNTLHSAVQTPKDLKSAPGVENELVSSERLRRDIQNTIMVHSFESHPLSFPDLSIPVWSLLFCDEAIRDPFETCGDAALQIVVSELVVEHFAADQETKLADKKNFKYVRHIRKDLLC
ncbi:hypothetical protein DFH09DRAFT_1085629 [Mycena vulgaris]|nr:hypothetical protein DFH09DRAFT_1085629 [Mycena vulgaris]